jgi:hypothetical protein
MISLCAIRMAASPAQGVIDAKLIILARTQKISGIGIDH